MENRKKVVTDGYHAVTTYLSVQNAAQAIAFYQHAFGAEEIYRLAMPDGKVGHAEFNIGDSRLMIADEFPDRPDAIGRSPKTLGGITAHFCVYVADVDAAYRRALEAGALSRRPVEDQFYGDRTGTVEDPFGHLWTLATRLEDVSPAEMLERMNALPKS